VIKMTERLIHLIRKKYPALSSKSARRPLAAIRLFCLECLGGSVHEVRNCTSSDCSLYAFRMGKRPVQSESPTSEVDQDSL